MARSGSDRETLVFHCEDKDLIYLTLIDDIAFLKITRACNNQCLFCCDTVFQDGGMMAPELVYETMTTGAQRGMKSVFFSGGEPTIHPDFIRFIAFAKKLGYQKIQAITNGRMFYYREFAEKALRAGLNEIVFSINSMNEKVHDRLVGAHGAFAQAVRGIENVREIGGCQYNINTLVTSLNYTEMPEMPEFFKEKGASGVDYILVAPAGVPAGRSKKPLQPNLDALYPIFEKTLEAAGKCGMPIGLKKFPENFYQGRENLIPDTEELYRELREIQRRRKLFDPALTSHTAPACFHRETAYCFMGSFCGFLRSLRDDYESGGFRYLRFSSAGLAAYDAFARERQDIAAAATLILRVDTLDALPELVAAAARTQRPYFLEPVCRDALLPPMLPPGAMPERITLMHPVSIRRFLNAQASDVEIVLTMKTIGWLNSSHEFVKKNRERIILRYNNFASETSQSPEVEMETIADNIRALGLRMNGFTKCLGAGADAAPHPLLDLDALAGARTLNIEAAARWFTNERVLTKSRRCPDCTVFDACPGMNLNYIRRFGYDVLNPAHVRVDCEAGR